MATAAQIDAFLTDRRVVLIGVSVCPSDVTRTALRELTERGYDIVPVRPGIAELEGRRAYPTVAAVPGTIDGAIIFTPPCRSERVVYECIEAGISQFWLDPGKLRGVNRDALELCERHEAGVITGGSWERVRPRVRPGWAHELVLSRAT